LPILNNPRHERFAQGLAAGKSASVAYVEAGFKANDGNASTLKGNQKVQDRVAELQARAVDGVLLTKAWVIEQLIDNVKRAKSGDKFDGATANRAVELLGKELGMFIERRQDVPASADMTDEQLNKRIRSIADAIRAEDGIAEPPGRAGEAATTH